MELATDDRVLVLGIEAVSREMEDACHLNRGGVGQRKIRRDGICLQFMGVAWENVEIAIELSRALHAWLFAMLLSCSEERSEWVRFA